MPTVRDKTLPKSEYKGRPIPAIDAVCPCRPCYNPHDCGYYDGQGHWVVRMRCATNWNHGCPPDESRKAVHIYARTGKVCKRCGTRR